MSQINTYKISNTTDLNLNTNLYNSVILCVIFFLLFIKFFLLNL